MDVAHQRLYLSLTDLELRDALERGARVVWVEHDGVDRWNAVLQTYVEDFHPEMAVLDFLSSVDPGHLETKMLESADMGTGVGTSALQALVGMISPRHAVVDDAP